jgi:hypothetical protein
MKIGLTWRPAKEKSQPKVASVEGIRQRTAKMSDEVEANRSREQIGFIFERSNLCGHKIDKQKQGFRNCVATVNSRRHGAEM